MLEEKVTNQNLSDVIQRHPIGSSNGSNMSYLPTVLDDTGREGLNNQNLSTLFNVIQRDLRTDPHVVASNSVGWCWKRQLNQLIKSDPTCMTIFTTTEKDTLANKTEKRAEIQSKNLRNSKENSGSESSEEESSESDDDGSESDYEMEALNHPSVPSETAKSTNNKGEDFEVVPAESNSECYGGWGDTEKKKGRGKGLWPWLPRAEQWDAMNFLIYNFLACWRNVRTFEMLLIFLPWSQLLRQCTNRL